jgi:hypothetical protein
MYKHKEKGCFSKVVFFLYFISETAQMRFNMTFFWEMINGVLSDTTFLQ